MARNWYIIHTYSGYEKKVRESLTAFADLAMGIKSCRWQMARPDANTMRLEAQVKLAPAETSGQ